VMHLAAFPDKIQSFRTSTLMQVNK
jgi:hypothetical protein